MKFFLKFLLILMMTNHAVAQPSGEELYTIKLCHTCHGVKGNSPVAPNFPKLCGQNSAYLKEQGIYIRDGKRATPMASSMRALVASVTDQEFEIISDYLQAACP